MLTSECRDNKELARQLGHYPGSEVASQSDKGGKGKRSAASRLMPPAAAEQQQWHHEDIAIVKPSYEDTSRNIPSRLPGKGRSQSINVRHHTKLNDMRLNDISFM